MSGGAGASWYRAGRAQGDPASVRPVIVGRPGGEGAYRAGLRDDRSIFVSCLHLHPDPEQGFACAQRLLELHRRGGLEPPPSG